VKSQLTLGEWAPEEKLPWQTAAREALTSQDSPDWATPAELYAMLDAEFHFDLDPWHVGGPGQAIRRGNGRRALAEPPAVAVPVSSTPEESNMVTKTLKPEDLGLCVCGRRIYASTQPPAVMHELPCCEKFLELEALEFLTYVRRSRGIPDYTL